MIKKWGRFINENKLFLFNRKSRIAYLIDSKIYPTRLINRWMKEYNFDQFAHCVLVLKNPIVEKPDT